ncbi:hypothetical protein [Gimesia maris]|uniref:Uncharacterized protein n=1 Tax=Gimesia maris TaxID=122 RepID=A0ABX5YTT5_9PLAN|nr:hypothetical protein [Gimesia maris]EDL58086.1 hypothetical protein PM8797T_18871 [Gimesia maris DSM 8797]QEG19020.1 hypothetical protein GmarT_49160 [Gimesia maris]QGQ28088.1 hypothetical protein F1729_05130 [Gimesia maris]
MNHNPADLAQTIKTIESIVPDGYGRMPIPSETDEELQEQIEIALQFENRKDVLLNQHGIDNLLKYVERMASECLRESRFKDCLHAAQSLELLLCQPDNDKHPLMVALALIHDAYFRLSEPRPEFDAAQLPLFCAEWNSFNQEKSSKAIHFRIREEPEGPRYICYW